ncbi:transcriptional regulatory protein AlgP-like [Xyrauchen texanus]|uniref:transcriptional regulatory protein AlgP-like n=1 Tax=Xyrauchen texanus TaxID=154827 RepID=UPI00224285DC|nr:transcriptional regulatory protein AlgP-like [Xyrauchen texanus]
MAVHEILLEHLEELESEEMKTFTWHLTQGVEDFSKISKSRLENKSRCEVVECMIDNYRTDGAAQLTLIILEKMKKNNLAEQLLAKLRVNGHQCTEALQSKCTNETFSTQKQERCKYGEASLDTSSPDYVPSVFVSTKPSQNPEAKLERYHRKRRRDDRPITATNLCVSFKTLKQECSMDHWPVKKPAAAKKPKSAATKKPAAKKSSKKAKKPAAAKKAKKRPKKAKKPAAAKKAAKSPKKAKVVKPKTAKAKAAKPKKAAPKKK